MTTLKQDINDLKSLGLVRLSNSFIMRDFLYNETACCYGISNIPHCPELAVITGRELCQKLLEPIIKQFGVISIQVGYRSPLLNLIEPPAVNNEIEKQLFECLAWDSRIISAGATFKIPNITEQIGYKHVVDWISENLEFDCVFTSKTEITISWACLMGRKVYSMG